MTLLNDGPVELDSPATMFAVLQELVGADALQWRGQVDVWGDEQVGPAKWRIEVNDDKGNTVTATLGDYLVLAYGHLLVLTADEVGS